MLNGHAKVPRIGQSLHPFTGNGDVPYAWDDNPNHAKKKLPLPKFSVCYVKIVMVL